MLDELAWARAVALADGAAGPMIDYQDAGPPPPWPADVAATVPALSEPALRSASPAAAGPFEDYLESHPSGAHVADALARIEEAHWTTARADGSPLAVRAFIERYPDGAHAEEAASLLASRLQDDEPFEQASRNGSVEEITAFLQRFPGHAREEDARAALVDAQGRDVFELIDEMKLEVTVQGAGIDGVTLHVRNVAEHGLTARVEPGTFFVSDNEWAQDMVATSRREFTIEVDAEFDVWIDAACASQHDAVPEEGDGFTMVRAPESEDLAKLAPALEAAGVDYTVIQAAVWIITDDSDYYGLGDLVSSFGGFGGSRMINEPEAARAMRIIADAGIDIRSRSIWYDREEIAAGLADGDELKVWLSEG
jgi:hypothetical protein